MKNAIKTSAMILATCWAVGCSPGEKNQEVEVQTPAEVKQEKKEVPDSFDAGFVDGMVGKAFNNYIEISQSLVQSDLEDAKAAASNLAETFEVERDELKSIAQKMSEAEDLDTFRKYFEEFTLASESMFSESLSSGTIYKKFCPMAFDSKGAYWLSDAEEINNPYFGEKMLHCGKVEKVITKK